jgi:hypothetical protein
MATRFETKMPEEPSVKAAEKARWPRLAAEGDRAHRGGARRGRRLLNRSGQGKSNNQARSEALLGKPAVASARPRGKSCGLRHSGSLPSTSSRSH